MTGSVGDNLKEYGSPLQRITIAAAFGHQNAFSIGKAVNRDHRLTLTRKLKFCRSGRREDTLISSASSSEGESVLIDKKPSNLSHTFDKDT